MRRSLLLSAALPAVVALSLAGCASEADTASSGSPTPSTSLDCTAENMQTLTPGTLTIGTDSPAYPPYFEDDDPSNGKGFESAVAYAVAGELGFSDDQVTWVTVPFNKSYAPGAKDFDFDINQISITPKRQKAVDFSDGYYTVNQAVVARKDAPPAAALQLCAAGLSAGLPLIGGDGYLWMDTINDASRAFAARIAGGAADFWHGGRASRG